jgi:predicted NBD/HSP70 family sugar kinase
MELALAIDIGGSKFSVGLVTRAGELIDRINVDVVIGIDAPPANAIAGPD